MRKSMSCKKSRLVRAGITTGAIAAVLLGTIATPAYATVAIQSVTPSTGATGAVIPLVVASTGVMPSAGTPGALLTTIACPGLYTTTATATVIVATGATRGDANTVTIPVPTTLLPGVYNVCVYAGTVAASSTLSTTSGTTYTVTTAAPALNFSSGLTGGGNTIEATAATNYLTAVTIQPGVNFTTSACSSTYQATPANLATTAVKTSALKATITVPAGVVMPGAYNVCIYAGVVAGSALLGTPAGTYTATPPTAALSAVSGLTGGGNAITLTATAPILNGISSPGVTFAAASCASTYGSPAANLVGTGVSRGSDNQVSVVVPVGVVAPNTYTVCIYTGSAPGSTLVGISGAVYTAMLPVIDLAVTSGKAGGTNTITGQAPNNLFTSIPTPGVIFRADNACTALYNTSGNGTGNLIATAARIAVNRLAITVPNVVKTTPGPDYKVCIYSGTGTSPLIGSAPKYTAVDATAILSVAPNAGPSGGKSLITITGTGFPNTLDGGSITAASIGGTPLTDITLSNDATYFTAKTPGHAPGANLTLSITTSAGDFTLKNAFTYTNGVAATPNTAPNESTTLGLYVVGVGYSSMTFDGTLSKAHVYMVNGKYDPSPMVGHTAYKANGPVAECTAVLPISDTELICTLQMALRLGAAGTAIGGARSVADGATLTDTTFSSATAHFTPADVGLTVTQTSGSPAVAVGTYIVTVVDDSNVVLNQPTTDNQTVTVDIGGSSRSVAAITTATGSTTLTGAAAKFVATDVGRPIAGGGIPANTIIVTVTPTGNGATISRAATASAAVTVTVSPAAQIPDGTYTMTVVSDGGLDAAASDPDYGQSIITSGSTFTVADY
jgi:IPT/TIG domain-containing protein